MGFLADFRFPRRTWAGGRAPSTQLASVLRAQTETFCTAGALESQVDSLVELFSGIWLDRSEQGFQNKWIGWLDLLEADAPLRANFQQGWKAMLSQLDSVSLLAEAGIPGQHDLLR